jgi:putative transposon-encoded protein
MSILIISGSNLPEETNVVMGDMLDSNGKNVSINIDITTISEDAKVVYNKFFELVGNSSKIEISNSPYNYNGNHVRPILIENNMIEIDYSVLNQDDKDVIDNAFVMLASIKEDSGIIS